jgi:23S rRNA (cytosine1962-C5)-methyltransferase
MVNPTAHPTIHLSAGHARRFRAGHPWIYSNEIVMDADTRALAPGTVVTVIDAGGDRLATGSFNPHSLIAVRRWSSYPDQAIDQAFLAERLSRALALRDTLFPGPFYRLVHAEADGLPGLIVDRFGDVLALQVNTAGAELVLSDILSALDTVLSPRAVLLKNDSPVRKLEGLELYERSALGTTDGPVELVENGARFFADLAGGQKTGWFYDQRDNRAAVAAVAKSRSVVDFYTYAGGFAVQAALSGATRVVAVDRSESSLALAVRAAEANDVRIEAVRAEAFPEMERMAAAGERFGVVITDPPAFIKSKKDLAAGAQRRRRRRPSGSPFPAGKRLSEGDVAAVGLRQ